MPFPLNNVTTEDDFTEAATLTPQLPGAKLNIILANNAAMMQVEHLREGMKVGSGVFDDEEYLVPGAYSMNRTVGLVRFRNATPGLNASITARTQ